ncbi:unnamed protein product [Miscanthus lutarioriparius]|uniref:Uncharacterized protein n=1 Tax=Miscanthus lutarioriparius TaxID=422564 RepID=A0A811MWS4_9POAL|nr:unnamed protein product [Miscanthus lutarioriparius]
MELKGETTMMDGVRMKMGALDCPICHKPLGPRIYQTQNLRLNVYSNTYRSVPWGTCSANHAAVSSARSALPHYAPEPSSRAALAWSASSKPLRFPVASPRTDAPRRCPTSTGESTRRRASTGHASARSPAGCGFTGPAAALRDHFTGHHKWLSTAFEYYAQFDLRLQPGPHVLHAKDGSSIFLVNLVPAAEPLGHAISLVSVQPEVSTDANKSMFGLSLMFSCFTGHHQVLRMEDVMSSSLADGLPKDVVCFVPRASRDDHAVVSITGVGPAGSPVGRDYPGI